MFAPHQIVRLACDQTQLYAEVIEVLEARQMCWVRPIALVRDLNGPAASYAADGTLDIKPLVDGPDLLWPWHQFRPALDMEVIPCLALVHGDKPEEPDSGQVTHQLLKQFIDQLWEQQRQPGKGSPEN